MIADESTNDSIITAKLSRQVSLCRGEAGKGWQRGKVERRLIFRMQMAGIIHILRQDDTASSSMGDGIFLSLFSSRARVARRGKFIRKVSTGVFRRPLQGEEENSVDLIGPSAFTESLIWDISFHACTDVTRGSQC